MEPNKASNLAKIVDDIEIIAKAKDDSTHEDGTVVDTAGQIIRLGEESDESGMIYGNPVELSDNLFPPSS